MTGWILLFLYGFTKLPFGPDESGKSLESIIQMQSKKAGEVSRSMPWVYKPDEILTLVPPRSAGDPLGLFSAQFNRFISKGLDAERVEICDQMKTSAKTPPRA